MNKKSTQRIIITKSTGLSAVLMVSIVVVSCVASVELSETQESNIIQPKNR